MKRGILRSISRRSSVYSTLIVMFFTLISRVFGFLKSVIVSAVFGGQGLADVVNAVFSIPNNLRKLLAEGALSTAFIPVINKKLVEDDLVGAQRLTRKILGLQWLILIPIVIVLMLFKEKVIYLFVNFSNEQQMVLSGRFLFYIAPYIILVCLSSVFMAVLNSHNYFFISAISPICFSLSIAMSVFFFSRFFGIFSLAFGVLLGGSLQLLIQYFACYRLGYKFSPYFSLTDPDTLLVLKTWLPVLFVSLVFFLNQQFAIFLASGLSEGSSSALANSIVFFQLPFGIFSASVNTVYYQRLTCSVYRNDEKSIRQNLTDGLRLLLIFLLPSSFFLIFLGSQIISVALMRGAFQLEHVLLTSKTLIGFSLGMFFMAACNFLQKYFYARNNVFVPFLIAICVCTVDVVLSLLLIKTPLGVAGLAYANSCAFSLCFIVLFSILHYKEKMIEIIPFLKDLIKVFFVLLVAFFVYLLLQQYFGEIWWQKGSTWASFMILVVYTSILGGVMFLGYVVFNIHNYSKLFSTKVKSV